ncbi:MAG: hypothetical protein ACRYGK_11315 [Janthinobacterium lividum]
MKKLLCALAMIAAMSPLTQASAAQTGERVAPAVSVPAGAMHQVVDRRDMRHPPRRMVRCRDGSMKRLAGDCRRHGGIRR